MSNPHGLIRQGLRRSLASLLIALFMLQNAVAPTLTPAFAQYTPGIPAAVDPGTPTFSGSGTPVPAEPVAYNPATSYLQAIYNADVAAGGNSYWIDRVLARPFLSADNSGSLLTRGRALYMFTYTPGTLGFAGGYAYRERPTGSSQNLYTITLSGVTLSETTAQRVQYPSHAVSLFTGGSFSVLQKKYITYNNVAITTLTITNTSASTASTTATVSSPIATSALGSELTGSVTLRYGLSTIFPRLSGDSFTVSGTTLTRSVSLGAGQSTTFKVQMGVLADEIPESTTDYNRYKGYTATTALSTQLQEYNQWWVDNVPYIDIPNANMKKMSYYRAFLNRYNYFDGNIPGNDYQFPVSIEGVTGYNNAIQLTQPMHMQDLKYFRNPVYAFGNWISSGETSKYGPFTDNPGDTAHWGVGNPNGTYEQYIAFESFESYKVHGGEPGLLNNLARYAEGDVTGQLAKYDQNNNYLISYNSGTLTGNDADAVAFAYYQREQERTETSFWYAGAKASAAAYTLLGNTSKANSMNTTATNMKNAILTLWDSAAAGSGGKVFKQKDIQTGSLVPWKDQQNWAPFIVGPDLVPNTSEYTQAFRFYADAAELPIMPFFTADQVDKAAAVAAGKGGSNNFSNINATLQAQIFLSALRNYSASAYITQDSYRKLVEWLTWTQYISGDNRLPDNNEYWWNYNGTSVSRSGIHHDILGGYNFMIIEGFMGMVPRADSVIELWPIDVGYDHFTVNNLRYHGQDLTLVWDKPGGTVYYGSTPEGYSAYLNGTRVFTVNDLTHLTWDSASGTVTILGTPATVNFSTSASLPAAINVSLSSNARMVDIAQKAGVDISTTTGGFTNLALGKTASASYTSTLANGTSPANAVDGFTVSGLPVTVGSWVGKNPIWGTEGSPNTQDWLQVDLGAQTTFDTVKLYFYSNKTFGTSGNTYRQPSAYSVQYYDGSAWVDVSGQNKTPGTPLPNYNKDAFPAVTAQLVRVLVTRTGTYGVGVKEIQIFNTGQGPGPTPTPTATNTPGPSPTPTITPTPTNTALPPQTDPVAYYPFEGNANDSSGNGYNGTLVNGPTFVTGQTGQAVNLDGTNDHVSLPIGSLISTLNDFSVATWVKLTAISNWVRIFDFGNDTTTYMFLTPSNGSTIRYAITIGGAGSETQLNGTAALPTGVWKHVAITQSGNTATLYVDGAQVGQNTSAPLRPSNLGNTINNWIGRSQYADPYLNGQIDEFRIYNRALSAAEVSSLFSGGPTPTPTRTNTPGPTNTPTPTPTATNTPAPFTVHVGGLTGSSAAVGKNNWRATVTITVVDAVNAAVANATVSGSWSTGGTGSCTTGANGQCSLTSANISNSTLSTTFTVSNISGSGMTYDPAANVATSIVINKP